MTDPTPTTSAETTTKSGFGSSKSAPSGEREVALEAVAEAARRAVVAWRLLPDDDAIRTAPPVLYQRMVTLGVRLSDLDRALATLEKEPGNE